MSAPINQTVIDLPVPPSTNDLFANKREKPKDVWGIKPAKRKKAFGRVKTERYNTWLNAAGWDVKRQRPKKIKGPVSIAMYVQEPRVSRDIDNCAKAVLDLLVSLNVIEADNNRIVRKLSMEWSSAVTGCRVAIAPAEAA